MTYHGGPVQHDPKVYLLLWGPSWSASGADALYLQHFLAGLGVQPQDTWSASMTQYTDSTGRPTFAGSVLQGVWQDTSSVPYGVNQSQLSAEADAFYTAQGLTDNINTQVVVATPPGTCPDGYYSSACPGNSGYYCAWHSVSSGNSVPFTNLPYLADGGQCGAGMVNSPGTYDGFSIVEGHEFAETVTDPLITGWYDPSDNSGGENGDKCAWTNLANVAFSTGSFPMQPLWSNSANSCVMSPPAGLPDLVVSSLTWTPSAVSPSTAVQFTATIKNQGSAPTPAGVIQGVAFLVDGTNVAFADHDTASLAAGASITLTATGSNAGPSTWPATRGKHTVKAWVDDQNRISESNEANNTLSKALNVYAGVSPSSVAITVGTLRAGTVTALAKPDSTYYQVNSSTAATRTADWSATTAAAIPNSSAGLQITYRGLNSRSCSQTIYLYNYRTGAWVSLKTATVGSSAVTTVIVPSGTAADYVSGTSGSGTVKVRIKTTNTTGSFYTSGDQVAVGYL